MNMFIHLHINIHSNVTVILRGFLLLYMVQEAEMLAVVRSQSIMQKCVAHLISTTKSQNDIKTLACKLIATHVLMV